MKISIIQYDILWEDKAANFRKIENLLADTDPETSLVILPEMFTSGFSMDPARLHEKPMSSTYRRLLSYAENGNFGICGSYIVKENNCYYNRWILVAPEGLCMTYDKRHLFTMAGEERTYTAGTKRIVYDFRGIRICPNICYDLRFPVWSRNRNDYDLLINSANWPEPRRDVWSTLLKSRAIENQCYVAGANRVGTDGSGIEYIGDSMIIGPKGEVIASAPENHECVITADISPDDLSSFRKKFPVLNDADSFTIN